MVPIIIAVLVAVVLTAVITWPCAVGYRKKVVEAKIGSAEDRARDRRRSAESSRDKET